MSKDQSVALYYVLQLNKVNERVAATAAVAATTMRGTQASEQQC